MEKCEYCLKCETCNECDKDIKLSNGVSDELIANYDYISELNTLTEPRGFKFVNEKFRKNKTEPILPKRMTINSAGYDFFLPKEVTIKPKESVLIWTDIKVYMNNDEVFELYPRSSIAIKHNIMLKNVVGLIDSDYYENISNDGNIGLCLYNFGNDHIILPIGNRDTGEGRIVQGIFKKYLVSSNCNSVIKRIGGIGSTKV